MKFFHTVVCSLVLFCALPAWSQEGQQPQPQSQPQPPQQSEFDAQAAQLINEGTRLIQAKKPLEALPISDQVIALYEKKFNDPKIQYFSARTPAESLMYLVQAANKNSGSASVASSNWAYAYFLKAFALQDLNRIDEATLALKKALALSPMNSQFQSELGNIYQHQKNWPLAIQAFQEAEKAKEFSPPDVKNNELSRAWRGLGYVYVEQNRLDDAENIYKQCLELDKNDIKAGNELRYVQSLKAKQQSTSGQVNTSNASPPAAQQPVDLLKLRDAYFATFFAAVACNAPNGPSPDVTNLLLVTNAAANQLAHSNPGMPPPEIKKILDDRIAKVKATVDGQIKQRGCDAPDIKTLAENFKKVSARPQTKPGTTPATQ